MRRARRAVWLLAEAGVLVALYLVYAALRNAQGDGTGAAAARAERHARDVLHVERLLHLDVELGLQRAALDLPHAVVRLADVYYATVHLPATALVLLWLLVTQGRRYAAWRTALVTGTAVSLGLFAAFPTMPPRLLPGGDYQDTLSTVGGLWSYATPALEHIAHPYAAMPSLHLLWALWVGAALWRCGTRPAVRRLGPLHVALTALVVVVTGNHWVLDLVAAGALAAVAALAARTWVVLAERLRLAARPPSAEREPALID